MATLLAAGLVSLAGCEYLLMLAVHRTELVDLRYEGVMGLGNSKKMGCPRWVYDPRWARLVDKEEWCEHLREDIPERDFISDWCMRFQEDVADPDYVFVRIRIVNEVDISPSGAAGLYCTVEGEQQEFGDWLLRRHPTYEDVHCRALSSERRKGRGSRDKARLHGSYVVRIGVGLLWSRRRGETRETFLRRPFGLRCQIRGGEMYTLTLRSNEIVIPAADLVRAISAHRGPAATPS